MIQITPQMRILVAGERPVACLAWSSAPRQLDLRNQFVGAPKQAYRHNLHQIAYNSRYLIVPWVQVPHLASHILGRIARRISSDWEDLYHHPVQLLESFVDIERFRGTKVKTHQVTCSIKELWVYPLGKRFRHRLRAGAAALRHLRGGVPRARGGRDRKVRSERGGDGRAVALWHRDAAPPAGPAPAEPGGAAARVDPVGAGSRWRSFIGKTA